MAWPDLSDDVKERVRAMFRPGQGQDEPDWLSASVRDGLDAVKTDVMSSLAGRGYSASQIEAWAAGPGRPLIISTAFFLVAVDSRSDIKEVDGTKVDPPAVLDRRKDIREMMAITDAAGNLIKPDAVLTAGSPVGGRVRTSGETFRTRDGKNRPW